MRVRLPLRHLGVCLVVLASFVGLIRPVSGQENAHVTAEAYLYLAPDASRPPFAKLEAGALVTILRTEGAWFNIRVEDIQHKQRYGYIEAKFVQPLQPVRSAPVIASSIETPNPAAVPTLAVAHTEPTPLAAAPLPPPAPAAPPPVSAPVAAPIRLQDVRRIFIEKMPNDLDQYISAEITKEFKGRVVIVLNRESADAIMRGIGENRTGVGAAITGRYLGLHDNASGSISLIDQSETVVLWASEAGDRSLMWGVLARGGQRKVADRLVNNLKKAIQAK